MASASAVSSGRGVSRRQSRRRVASITCGLSAWPYPVTACLICRGVYSYTGTPAFCAASRITPLACATPMAVVLFE